MWVRPPPPVNFLRLHKHPVITERRIDQTITRRILPLLYTPVAPLQLDAFAVCGEPISFERAIAADYQPFAVGQEWGGRWDTVWFRVAGEVPKEGRGREIVALIDLGFEPHHEGFTVEGLVWREGVPVSAVNVKRQDVGLFESARSGEEFAFYIEAAANPAAAMHDAAEALRPDYGGRPLGRVRRADLAIFHPEAKDLYYDMKAAFTAMKALPENSPRRGELLAALNRAVNLFDDQNPHQSVAPMREALRESLASRNGGSAHQISAIGHAHIDTAWLWPLRETIRKCARTFATALLYMEAYPDYKFACSQPQQYAWMKEYFPAIYAGIKKAIRRGQWEPVGSMWIEADCNLSSGESLIRQLLHGKNFFLDEFGYETRDVWIPDVFGYCAALPQIMKSAGVNYFLTQKISWSQFNKFPHHTFLWEGIDGTRIFTHFPPADTYNASMLGESLVYNVKNFKENDRATRSLYLYGFGDGGGGPTKEMLELAARFKDFDGLPKVELERAIDFFPKAEADASDLPVWSGELYLEMHRGTYTTQAANKRGNRKSEFLLRDAEYFDAISRALGLSCEAPAADLPAHAGYDVINRPGGQFPGSGDSRSADLDRAWKLVLLNQFHDIIPGSSIAWVYEDSARDYETISALAHRVLDSCVRAVASRIDTRGCAKPWIVFNTLGHARSETVTLPDGAPAFVTVPAYGHAVVDLARAALPQAIAPVTASQAGDGSLILDNGILRVAFDARGEIASILDHRGEREVLAAPGNRFQLHRDYPNAWDAWDVDVFYKEAVEDCTGGLEALEIVESSAERATIRMVRRIGAASRVEQHVRLCAGSARVDFETDVDWHEDHRFLKVAFPVRVRSPRATYEIQYGNVERPTHSNTSWDLARFEVCAQKWADLSEGDYGVALLNDCKYGYDIEDGVMRLSLLRAPSAPDPTADRGEHRFTYALLPHAGDFRIGKVIEQAYALNVPLRLVRPEAAETSLPATGQFFRVNRANVIIEAVKKAEKENAIIVRLYEAHGSRGPATLGTTLGFREAFTADLLERTLAPVKMSARGEIHFDIGPFEIVTLKFPLPS